MRTHQQLGRVVLLLAAVACASPAIGKEPLYQGLGDYKRKVSTQSADAQAYFDQGLAFLMGFNHGAAIRSFQQAAYFDPSCAMAHWGIAIASGPHINMPVMTPPQVETAWKELQLAKQYADVGHATDVEKALIDALARRYSEKPVEDRAPLDKAYAEAMREVWTKYPNDPDVGVFFAEAMMDLRPWDQWTKEGEAQPGTEEVLATLDQVLKLNINHPLANHLYIHANEASLHPDRASAAADRLRTLQPGLAHNVHMPSHIDIRCGRWQQSIDTNERAVAADQKFREVAGPAKGFLNVYVAHNRHMLAYSAMMCGQSDLAIREMRAMVANLPEDFVREFAPIAGAAPAMPLEVLVRFGKWDEVLAEPEPDKEYMHFAKAFRHAARAIAYAAKGDAKSARAEQKLYVGLRDRIPEGTFVMGQNSSEHVCPVVNDMVEGEILIREGKTDEAIAALKRAVAAEDRLRYEEPPGWLIPVRHSLGAALMSAGRYAEAESVYRADLKAFPENGWSLYGLSESLRRQDKTDEAAAARDRFDKVWAKADTRITSSCLCQLAD